MSKSPLEQKGREVWGRGGLGGEEGTYLLGTFLKSGVFCSVWKSCGSSLRR